jgi:hypothetical protein
MIHSFSLAKPTWQSASHYTPRYHDAERYRVSKPSQSWRSNPSPYSKRPRVVTEKYTDLKAQIANQDPKIRRSRTTVLTHHAKARMGLVSDPQIRSRKISDDEILQTLKEFDFEVPSVSNGKMCIASGKNLLMPNGKIKPVVVVHTADVAEQRYGARNLEIPQRLIVTAITSHSDLAKNMDRLDRRAAATQLLHIRDSYSRNSRAGGYDGYSSSGSESRTD